MFIIVNSALYGVVTSILIHSLNSIMKVFATAVELVLIAIFSWVLFGYPLNLQTVSAVCIVSCSVVIYAKHPISKNTLPKSENKNTTINV